MSNPKHEKAMASISALKNNSSVPDDDFSKLYTRVLAASKEFCEYANSTTPTEKQSQKASDAKELLSNIGIIKEELQRRNLSADNCLEELSDFEENLIMGKYFKEAMHKLNNN